MGVPEQTASDPADAPVYTDIPKPARAPRVKPRLPARRRRGNACGSRWPGRREEAHGQARGATCVCREEAPRPKPFPLLGQDRGSRSTVRKARTLAEAIERVPPTPVVPEPVVTAAAAAVTLPVAKVPAPVVARPKASKPVTAAVAARW